MFVELNGLVCDLTHDAGGLLDLYAQHNRLFAMPPGYHGASNLLVHDPVFMTTHDKIRSRSIQRQCSNDPPKTDDTGKKQKGSEASQSVSQTSMKLDVRARVVVWFSIR